LNPGGGEGETLQGATISNYNVVSTNKKQKLKAAKKKQE